MMFFKGHLAGMALVAATVLIAAGAKAGSPHVHGLGELNLVQEGGTFVIELRSPAANIVGFEHASRSASDHAAVDSAMATLKRADELFRFPAAAGCRTAAVEIESSLLDGGDEHEHEAEHGHAEHAASGHADVAAEYQIKCSDPQQISQLRVTLFEVFPQMQRLVVQAIFGDRQVITEVTPSQPLIRF